MTRYRLKLVPKASPNADGHWIEVEHHSVETYGWIATCQSMAEHIPDGYFLVQLLEVKMVSTPLPADFRRRVEIEG